MDLGLDGRRAAVAAASTGLGHATASALVGEGVRVAICGRDRARVHEAAEALGSDTVPVVADVADSDQASGFVAEARERLGGVDILVANAGGPPPGTFATTELDAYRRALDLNLLSTVAMCRDAVPDMRAQRWGRVVAITSYGARQPIATLIASTTARTGVTGFLKVLATEVAADGVTVNSIQPGLHATDRIAGLYGGDLSQATDGVPAGVVGTPGDFGAVAAFLCSEPARYVTGVALAVDGGASRGLQ